MKPRWQVCLLCSAVLACLPLAAPASSDPVTDFIVRADSLANAGGDELLAPYVAARMDLVGAAVGQLLDVAFDLGEGGDAAAENENLAFAERLARLHWVGTGSRIPLELVEIYRSWTPGQRVARVKAKALEAEAFELQKGGEYDRAAELFAKVIEQSQAVDDRRLVAVTWGSLGVVNWYRGDMVAVQGNYEKALDARRAIEDRILEGKTLNGLGSVAWRAGEYARAVECYDRAAECRRETGDFSGLGVSLTYRGNAYYQMGRLYDARRSFEEAYDVLERYGGPKQMVEVLNSTANIHSEMGRLEDANQAYRRALEIASTIDRPQDEATCRINLAGNLRIQGRFREALEELDRVPPLLERQPEPEKTMMFYRERGETYRVMGELDDARDSFIECLEQAKKLDAPYYRIEALVALGGLYKNLGAYDRGLEVAKEAMTLAQESGNERLLEDAYGLAAENEQLMGRLGDALEHRTLALELERKEGAEARVIQNELGIATLRALMGETEGAREAIRETLARGRVADDRQLEWVGLFGLGHTFEKQNPDSACHYYDEALSLIETSRSEVGGVETRTGFLSGELRFLYEEVARYYVSLDAGRRNGEWSSRGFYTVERAKARGLLDLLERTVFVESAPEEEAVLDSLYGVAGDSPDDVEAKRRLEKRYLALRDKRFSATVGRIDPRGGVVGIEELRKRLPKNTVLLEYALGDTMSLLWVVDRKGHETFEIPNRESLRPDVERLRDAIEKPGAGDAALRESARRLYEMLIHPVERRIAGARRLVIVPDGFLFEVPFEVLLTQETDSEADWRDLPYLARSFETVYAPSASIFFKMSHAREKRKYGVELVAFGDPDFSGISKGPAAGLAELPYSRSEVEKIASDLRPDKKRVFLGADASERQLKAMVRSGGVWRILHLATHGLVDRAEPTASSIVLTPDTSDTSGSPDTPSSEDGYLYALEILSMPLGTGLVVLSACESAAGQIGRGEGVVGLSRAFIASGTGGVVASLWAVSDESTSDLMEAFYASMLGKKRPASEGLKQARLSLIADPKYAHPFYWSPFVLIGTFEAPW